MCASERCRAAKRMICSATDNCADIMCCAGMAVQSIVISLKDNFYEKADALVGVARDADTAASATYTFDLTRYGEG